MFTDKQQSPPSKSQLLYIESLERKTGLIFYGTTTREAIKFIDKAKQTVDDVKMIKSKIEREDKKFPFPNLKDDLPSDKQWAYIRSLEEKTKFKFDGITKHEAREYIEFAKNLLSSLPPKLISEIEEACSIIPNINT